MKFSYEYLETTCMKNTNDIDEYYEKGFELIKQIFDKQYFILEQYVWILINEPYAESEEFTSMLGTALIKNMYSFFSAYNLTKQGLVGTARLILRNVLEFLIIGKYISLSKDTNLLDKWKNGKTISLGREVFKNISAPKSKEIERYWDLLCSYTHSSVYSQQLEIAITEENRKEVYLNMVFLLMLLEMNYHLLNSHYVTKSMRYYAGQIDEYHEMNTGENKIIPTTKKELRELFKMSKSIMEKEPRKVISDYKLTWQIKDKKN